MRKLTSRVLAAGAAVLTLVAVAPAAGDKPDFKPFDEVAKGYEKVVSTADGKKSLYTLWVHKKDNQMLAELPSGYQGQKHYIALTMPTGEIFAGLQLGEQYVYWKRFGKRMALVQPNVGIRSTGDQASKDAIKHHFVERVLIDVPIVCMGPSGQPVIDMDSLLVGKASTFYGRSARGLKPQLATIQKAKAFPENVEIAFEVPSSTGHMKRFHYSLSRIPESNGYKPRAADQRVGFFTTAYRDLGKFQDEEVWRRYVNRWRLEKADPSLKVSPPKEPITFYLEHTVPVRYRRWVKAGAVAWNEAFEKIGISDAIVVHYQDKATGAHMDKDPEDVRYNFIRWLANDIGTAIGPSRAHPLTGQILDADVVLTDGWIRHFWYQSNDFLPDIAMEGFSAETLAWLDENPQWDPRMRLADPGQQEALLAQRAKRQEMGPTAWELVHGDGHLMNHTEMRDLAEELGPEAMLCMASVGKAHEMQVMGLAMEVLGLLEEEKAEGEDEEEEVSRIDGIPEWFVGPMLADLVMHEVGHTIGLRHNFKASGNYSLKEINSEEFKGKKPFAGSVMDYLPVNFNMDDGEVQGDYAMIGVGPYDMWAIEYGYGFEDPKEVLKRVSDPEVAYLTDEDTSGTDPLARRYDFAQNPLDYAKSRMRLAELSRGRILDKFVKDGQSWARARRGYEITLGTHMGALSIMANWLGGAFVNRDRKGDPGDRLPLEVVSVEEQREALKFVIENSFYDEAFGLSPELLQRMTVDKWWDEGGFRTVFSDATWQIHDRIAGVQASALTMLMNPTTLRRVYDNEVFVDADNEALTLPEVMGAVAAAVWSEVGFVPETHGGVAGITEAKASKSSAAFSARKPMISSLRRNLQREYLERLIDLSMKPSRGSAGKTVAMLARATLTDLGSTIEEALEGSSPDVYTRAHLRDAHQRIQKALDATYSYNSGGGNSVTNIYLGKEVSGN